MKLYGKSVIVLHELYHRREGETYVVGDPETGEHLFVTPVEFRALQLLNSGISISQVEELLREERDRVDLHKLISDLRAKKLIHSVDGKILEPHHEPIHEFAPNLSWFGGPVARFILFLITFFGIITLVFFGSIPGPGIFFASDSLTISLILVIVVAWLLVFIRKLVLYAAAQAAGMHARFGLGTSFHFFVPKTYLVGARAESSRTVLGTSLLALTSFASLALMLSVFLGSAFFAMVFAVAWIEMLMECLLFMDTDLAKLIDASANIYKLNHQTAAALKADWKNMWSRTRSEVDARFNQYAFLYLASIVLAVILVAAYVIPGMMWFLTTAFRHFTPGDPAFFDAFFALAFFALDLLLYALATIRHHPLAHNNFFVNGGVLALTIASFIIAHVIIQWLVIAGDAFFGIIIVYLLGITLALLFERAVRFAHPFTELHTIFEAVLLPILAACLPLSVLFSVDAAVPPFLEAAMLAIGMLSAIAFTDLRKNIFYTRASRRA